MMNFPPLPSGLSCPPLLPSPPSPQSPKSPPLSSTSGKSAVINHLPHQHRILPTHPCHSRILDPHPPFHSPNNPLTRNTVRNSSAALRTKPPSRI
ncbi:hypothetical protein M758_UG273300 [Ceratodon purpureus]|nr:hypothetical protein M758_UG273300 [Ceratodon purpureus]